MNKISVVVPIYKVEKYLNECINSLVNQTYDNLEIILVDDGSPDNCPIICDEWAEKDDRIIVIHKPNGGLSDARNCGIKKATGEFITFVDSDDYVELNAYEIAIENLINQNADVFVFGRYYLYGNKKEKDNKMKVNITMNNIEALDKMNTFNYFDVAAWDKVYKRNLFDDLEYPIGKLSEDWYTTYKVIDRAKKIIYNSTPLYVYRQRANSITHSDNVKINEEPILASKEVMEFICIKYPKIELNAITRYVYAIVGVYNNYIMYKKNDKTKIKELLTIISNNYKKIIKNKELSFNRKAQLYLISKFNLLYNYFIIIYKKYKNFKSK